MTDILSKFTYITEILLAELIFLFPFPKRKYFAVRYSAAVILNEALWFFFSGDLVPPFFSTRFGYFFLMMAKIILTIFSMWFCFDGSVWAIVSACVGGVALQHIGYQLSWIVAITPPFKTWNIYIELVTCAVLYFVFLLSIGIRIAKQRYYENYDKRMIVLSVVIILICIGIIRFFRPYTGVDRNVIICFSLYAVTCNSLALFIQFFWYRFARLKSDYAVLQRIHEEEVRQYENSKMNTKLLNIKCHDLKHNMLAIENSFPPEEVDSMQKIIDAYDNTYQSGLEVLDVILNEKIIRCMSKGISFTCMGDGKILSFMQTMDLYSLFGNMIENAIEATEKLSDKEKRTISLVIEKKGEFVYVNAVNYTNQRYSFEDGLPQTTKKGELGYHGYGLKSIRAIAEKYHGGIAIKTEDDVFILNVYMLPQ